MNSLKSSGLPGLKRISKRLSGKYRNSIVDIFLFGSALKGKAKPGDIDLYVILRNMDEKAVQEIYRDFRDGFGKGAHFNWIFAEKILEDPVFVTVIEEGVSLISGMPLSRKMGYAPGMIFAFSLGGMASSKKVLFSYALHGKAGKEGLLARTQGKVLGKGAIFIPAKFAETAREFMELWNADYSVKKVLMAE
jgi:predicted nucleotidyltransferase